MRWSRRRLGGAEREARLPAADRLGLRDSRLSRDGIHIVRRNIENLIKFSQCFWEMTKVAIGKSVLGEQVNVARVESLGFVEVVLAPLGNAPVRNQTQLRQ